MGDLPHRFDWYQATVPAHHELILRELLANVPETVERVDIAKGKNGYLAQTTLSEDDEVLTTVLHGGPNGNPNVCSTSDHAPALANLLRALFPIHRVTRLDVCIDMRGEGLFDQLQAMLLAVAAQHRVQEKYFGPADPERSSGEGRTQYVGSPSSWLRVVCYEKGKELFAATGDPAYRDLFDWTRLELRVRPMKDFKSDAAQLGPEAFWGCSPWTRDVAAEALSMNPTPITARPRRVSNQERAMRWLTEQYGSTILEQVRLLGGWDPFLLDLRSRLGQISQDEAA